MAKMRKNSSMDNREKKFRLPLSAYLGYLMIITLILSGISLARYTASSSDIDVAKVAVFKVSATRKAGQQSRLVLDAEQGTSGEYVFEVQNDSQMAAKYTVTVNNLPVGIEVRMGERTITSTAESPNIAFDTFNIDIGETNTCTLTFTALDEADIGTYEGISVDVQFEQID